MTRTDMLNDQEMDSLFRAAADNPPAVSGDLLERIMADADMVADERASAASPASTAPKVGIIAGLMAAIGGWPAMAGLASATLAGVWIGFAPPAAFDDLADGLMGTTYYDLGDFMPSIGDVVDEG